MPPTIGDNFRAELEDMGLYEAKKKLAHGEFSPMFRELAEDWVRFKTDEQEESARARAEAREEESLSIARNALDNSRLATRIAISAIVLSISMAMLEVIRWLSK